jgi:hypothetical protein
MLPVEAWIAPGPAELTTTLVALEVRLDRAETVGEAAERLQNRWGGLRPDRHAGPCQSDPDASALAARLLVFGPAWRDDVQSVRAAAARLEYLLVAPTVVPLLDPETWERVDHVRARTAREVAGYQAFAAWHQRFFLPSAHGCETGLAPAAGVGNSAPSAPEEVGRPVAVVGIGGGVVCPAGAPADGRVVVLPGPEACMGGPDCACEPLPVDPGAVLYGRR